MSRTFVSVLSFHYLSSSSFILNSNSSLITSMHRRHLADDQLVPQSDTPRSMPSHSDGHPQPSQHGSLENESYESDLESDTPFEPPPSYEQSIHPPSASTSTLTFSSTISRVAMSQQSTLPSNPFLDQTSSSGRNRPTRPSRTDVEPDQDSSELFAPRMDQRFLPSAPPITLLSSTSASPSADMDLSSNQIHERRPRRSATTPNTIEDQRDSRHGKNRHDQDSGSSAAASSGQMRRGKQPARNAHPKDSTMDDEVDVFGAQPAISPSFLSSPSQASSQPQGYFRDHNSGGSASRTDRRLRHKQDLTQYHASAPQLSVYPSLSQSTGTSQQMSPSQTPIIPLSQAIVPAPPARLLQFRSREPSAVPACPFLLCQKPIAVTKTRRERGVTVWIVCGLLFLCNTYWTTQSLMSHFASPNRERVSADDPSTTGGSGFTARGEAGHLVKGFLGFKTHRYQDPTFKNYQRHQMAMTRPTIATVGVVQDEQSAIRMILSFCLLAAMAIIRWWLCLTPLLVRPLFDTVHSCPHTHPYPYPEEIEKEQQQIEELMTPYQDQQTSGSFDSFYSSNEKERFKVRDEAIRHQEEESSKLAPLQQHNKHETPSPPSPSLQETMSSTIKQEQHYDNGPEPVSEAPPVTKSRYKFFQRLGALRRRRHEIVAITVANATATAVSRAQAVADSSFGHDGMVTATVAQIRRKKLSWSVRRQFRKAEERRQQVIKASQDIGRYSLLFELGALLRIGGWKESVLAPSKIRPEAYED